MKEKKGYHGDWTKTCELKSSKPMLKPYTHHDVLVSLTGNVSGRKLWGSSIQIIITINKVDSVSFFLHASSEDVLFLLVLEVITLDTESTSKIKPYVCTWEKKEHIKPDLFLMKAFREMVWEEACKTHLRSSKVKWCENFVWMKETVASISYI